MKLTDLDNKPVVTASRALSQNYEVPFNMDKMGMVNTVSMLNKVRGLMSEAKETKEFYQNQASPSYMKLVFMEQALSHHYSELKSRPASRIVVENEEVEKSQVVLAAQEMIDEMRDSSDYEQEDWLKDIGIDFMSEAEREWNLDWPHWLYYNEEGEVDVDTVGDEFGRAMGVDQVNTSSSYHGGRRDGKHWIIEPDSSIDAEQGDGGLEFVSPPMPLEEALEKLEAVTEWANDPSEGNAYTNSSTGLHMGVSIPYKEGNVDYLKLILFLGDEHVLQEFERESNTYTKAAMRDIRSRAGVERNIASVMS